MPRVGRRSRKRGITLCHLQQHQAHPDHEKQGESCSKPNISGQGHTEGCDQRDPEMAGVAQPSREQHSSASPQNHPYFGCAPDPGHVRRAVRGERHPHGGRPAGRLPSQPGSKHTGGLRPVLGSPSRMDPLRPAFSPGGHLTAAGRLTWRRLPPQPPHAPERCRTPLRADRRSPGRPRGVAGQRAGLSAPGEAGTRRRCRRSSHQQQHHRRRAPGPWAARLSPAPRRCRPGARSRAQVLK